MAKTKPTSKALDRVLAEIEAFLLSVDWMARETVITGKDSTEAVLCQ